MPSTQPDDLALHLPAAPGTYLLLMRLDVALTRSIGRLGTVTLAPGLYAYIGSAHGPGGLRARVGRHLRADKTPHWHIDALTAVATIQAVWIAAAPDRRECLWARTVARVPGVSVPVPGFGSSDCACATHLFALPPASVSLAWEALGQPAVALQR